MAFRMHGLNGLLFIAWEDPLLPLVTVQMERNATKEKQSMLLIPMHQFVTLINNNKLYSLLNQIY